MNVNKNKEPVWMRPLKNKKPAKVFAAPEKESPSAWKSNKRSMPMGARSRQDSCKISEHEMLIPGGWDANDKRCSDGAVYNIKTKKWWTLPYPMPAALVACNVVATGDRHVFVVGGRKNGDKASSAVYRLSLKSWKWTTMEPMDTARYGCAIALVKGFIHVFGGEGSNGRILKSAERYSITDGTWEYLPHMEEERKYHRAAVFGTNIVITGGACSVLVFDVVDKIWKTEAYDLYDMPGKRNGAAVVTLKDRYLVVIGGYRSEDAPDASSCLILDVSSNHWYKTPAYMNMSTPRRFHSATVLDGKIVVAGGYCKGCLSSMEYIDADTLLKQAKANEQAQDEFDCVDDEENVLKLKKLRKELMEELRHHMEMVRVRKETRKDTSREEHYVSVILNKLEDVDRKLYKIVVNK